MFILTSLERVSAKQIACCVALPQHDLAFLVELVELAPAITSYDISGLSPEQLLELHDRDEFRAFTRILQQFAEGMEFHLPLEVLSDLPP